MRRILLVEPEFPIPAKSRNHRNFLPIGLLKIATYFRDHGNQVKLVRGIPSNPSVLAQVREFDPSEVWVTSLFTYWASYVRDAVQIYKELFPNALIKVGGIYASLLPPEEVKEYTGCDEVHQGVIPEVEVYAKSHPPAYDLVENTNPHPIDFQIVHASRGCQRKCPFCGTWKIEPRFTSKTSLRNEIRLPGVVFYDNNFLMNPHIENLLEELIELNQSGVVKWVESQSGLDGRILLEKAHLANLMKDAGFRYPRIAWDWGYDQNHYIEKQIKVLLEAGYRSKDVFVFMLYNHQISFEEMERKRIKCWEWQVQISDCRFRPLTQLFDNYRPQVAGQTSGDYFISEGWTDALVKQFRRNVRRQNICVRMRYSVYSSAAEHKKLGKKALETLRKLETADQKRKFLETLKADWWIPDQVSYPKEHTR